MYEGSGGTIGHDMGGGYEVKGGGDQLGCSCGCGGVSGEGSREGAYELDREDWKDAASGLSVERDFFGSGVTSMLVDLPRFCSSSTSLSTLGSGILPDLLGRGVVSLSVGGELMV